jgi:hypothetical protein
VRLTIGSGRRGWNVLGSFYRFDSERTHIGSTQIKVNKINVHSKTAQDPSRVQGGEIADGPPTLTIGAKYKATSVSSGREFAYTRASWRGHETRASPEDGKPRSPAPFSTADFLFDIFIFGGEEVDGSERICGSPGLRRHACHTKASSPHPSFATFNNVKPFFSTVVTTRPHSHSGGSVSSRT